MWDDAWAYDLATAPFKTDIDFWLGLIDELRPRRVLELGCGTGRIAFALAERGFEQRPDFQFVGLDINGSFLDRARARLISTHPALASSIRFVEGDMSSFSLDDRYDLIVLGCSSFNYLTEREQQLGCLRSIRRHLDEGGHFALDLRVPDMRLLAEARVSAFPALRLELEWRDPAPGVNRFVSFYKTTSYDAATQTEQTTHYGEIYYADGRHQSLVKELTWHHFFPSELRNMLCQSGLAPVTEYGGYDRMPFSGTAPNYLWIMAPA